MSKTMLKRKPWCKQKDLWSSVLENNGTLRRKSFGKEIGKKKKKIKLPKQIHIQKNAEESGPVYKTLPVELEITLRKDLKELATTSLQQGRD